MIDKLMSLQNELKLVRKHQRLCAEYPDKYGPGEGDRLAQDREEIEAEIKALRGE